MKVLKTTKKETNSLTERVYRELRTAIITGKINGGTRLVESNLADATSSLDPFDPVPSCVTGGREHTVWYEYTAAADGWILVSTAGSTFDSFATVYSGSCGAFTEAACDDDTAGGGCSISCPLISGDRTSDVSFPVSAGVEYFVEVGSTVSEGQTICIIEAMKVMNEIKAERGGTITEVSIEDATPVQYGDVLFRIK